MVLFIAFLDCLVLAAISAQWHRFTGHRLILWFTISAAIFGPGGIVLFNYGILLPRYLIGRISTPDAIVFELYFGLFCLGTLFTGFIIQGSSWIGRSGINGKKLSLPPLVASRDWDINRLYLALAAFLALSYLGGLVRFHNPLYFVSGVNTFQNMVGLAKGNWFILILSLLFTIPASMLLGALAERRRVTEFVLVALVTAIATLTIGKAPVRTITIAFLAAAFLISRPLWQRWAYSALCVAAAPAAVFLLLVLNLIRQNLSFEKLAVNLEGSTIVLLPVVNGVYLIKNVVESDYFWFKSTLIAMTPIVLIPSAILPVKNYQEIQAYFTNVLFPVLDTKYNSLGSVLTYTLVGSSYGNLGAVGVLVGGGLWCLQIYLVFRMIAGDAVMRAIGILLLISISVSFRTSLETIFINIQYHLYVALAVRLFCSKGFGKAAAPRTEHDAVHGTSAVSQHSLSRPLA
jgi:hypothetical protein